MGREGKQMGYQTTAMTMPRRETGIGITDACSNKVHNSYAQLSV